MIISLIELEKLLQKPIKKNIISLGVDTATRSGWVKIKTTDNEILIEYGFINIDIKDPSIKFNKMIEIFDDLLKKVNVVVIEDVFLKFNVKVHSFLARVGIIVYVLAHLHNIKDKKFILASTARKSLGLKGNAKKDEIHKEIQNKFHFNIDDPDIVDAFVLSLIGIIQEGGLGV